MMNGMPRRKTLAAAAAYGVLALADSTLAGKTSPTARRLRYALKPALMPALATAFLDGTDGRTGLLRRSTAVAQAFSWGGDVALLGRGERAFLTGVGSFFGAHLAYITGFLSVRGDVEEFDTTGLKAALGLWLTTAPVMSLAAGRKDPALRGPVAAYATILAAMFASSRTLDPSLPCRARRTLQAGTALFLVSDTILGLQEFLLKEPHPALESAVMATYTAGQGLIAAGVAGVSA